MEQTDIRLLDLTMSTANLSRIIFARRYECDSNVATFDSFDSSENVADTNVAKFRVSKLRASMLRAIRVGNRMMETILYPDPRRA